MSELPRGWTSAPIDELGELRLGKMLDKAKNQGLPAKYLRNINVRWFRFDLDDMHTIFASPPELEQLSVEDGDLFICEGGEPGRCAVWRGGDNVLVYQKALHRFRSNGSIVAELLMYRLRHVVETGALADAFTGTTIKHLTRESIARFKVPVPPLPEQKRITEKLDALLARVDACRERLDRVPGILKRFRQSVLAAATSGELTRAWREAQSRPTTAYDLRHLGELVREPLRNGKSVRDGDGPMVLRLSSIRNGSIDWREAKSGEWGDIDVERFLVEDGDFLVARGNGSRDLVGRGSLVLGAPPRVAFPDTMIRVRPDPNRVVPQFLKLVWDAESTRNQIEFSARTTAGIWKVAQPDLEAIALPVPSLDEQAEVVRRTEELLSLAANLDARCRAAHSSVERLTPSILAKAFCGELVPQDPNDEPASRLLARLRGLPDSEGNTSKSKRRGTQLTHTNAKADSRPG